MVKNQNSLVRQKEPFLVAWAKLRKNDSMEIQTKGKRASPINSRIQCMRPSEGVARGTASPSTNAEICLLPLADLWRFLVAVVFLRCEVLRRPLADDAAVLRWDFELVRLGSAIN